MVRDLMPAAGSIAVLHNPSNLNAESNARQLNIAAATLGRKLIFAKASTDRELETAFANMPKERASALFVSTDAFFTGRRIPIVALAERYAIPAVYTTREFADVGGLISYGSSRIDAYHHAGVYVGRILKGEKPADLPVIQPTKFELVINLKTAKALGLIIPETLLATADEVIQ
jgi:putative ABC transport system substrate-binding protein